ncbi:MAG TPA: hypothetical protein DCO77_03575 [Nitrospiraceae bacterium]|nr:hypothetical protein [Nitrospiraceae bacterium]
MLSLLVFSSTAHSWGLATHAYLDDQLNRKGGLMNAQEIYGGMAPDLFNYMFTSPYASDLYMQTHYQFMKVWDLARSMRAKALSYGFVSHNNLWGADSTAHHAGRTVGLTEGYVIAKAKALGNMAPLPPQLGIPPELTLTLYHAIVEAGVDILVTQADPLIGQKMIDAALYRSRSFPYLLVRAYAADFSPYFGNPGAAARAIRSAESAFRKNVILYGYALVQDDMTSVQLVAEQMAETAEEYLAAQGIPLPPKEQLEQLLQYYLRTAMLLCEPDYRQEITATREYVDQQLIMYGITH